MRVCFTLLIWTLLSLAAFSQTNLYISGGDDDKESLIFVDSEAILYVSGDYVDNVNVADDKNSRLHLSGTLVLGGNLVNQGTSTVVPEFAFDTVYQSRREVRFIGAGDQSISGNRVYLPGMEVNKPSGDLILDVPSLSLFDDIELVNGGINLQDNEITLLVSQHITDAEVLGENEDNKIYGNGGAIHIQTRTFEGTGTSVEPGGLGLHFVGGSESNYESIRCSVSRFHSPRSDVADGSAERYYVLTPDGPGNIGKRLSNVRIEYYSSPLYANELNYHNIEEYDLGLYFSNDGASTWRPYTRSNSANTSPLAINEVLTTGQYNYLTLAERNCDNNLPGFNIRAVTDSDNSPNQELNFSAINGNSINVCELSDLDMGATNSTHTYYRWTLDGSPVNETTEVDIDDIDDDEHEGNYNLFVRNSRGCELSKNLQVNVRSNPTTNFSMTPHNGLGRICTPQEITFDGSGSDTEDGSTITRFIWEYGDGQGEVIAGNPLAYHTYGEEDLYLPNLTVETEYECMSFDTDEDTDTLTILDPPKINDLSFRDDFYDVIDEACEREVVLFEAEAEYYDSTPKREDPDDANTTELAPRLVYDWDFDDGEMVADEAFAGFSDVEHAFTYRQSNRFNIRVTARDYDANFSCVSNSAKYLYIHPLADATFEPEFYADSSDIPGMLCEGVYLYLHNTSSIRQGDYRPSNISGYWWDFDNGTESTEEGPVFEYLQEGTYGIDLVAYSDEGCISDTTTYDMLVNPAPDGVLGADIYPEEDTVCVGEDVHFVNGTTIPSGTVTYVWDFGDGTTSTDTEPVKTYSSPGIYPVSLTRTSDEGCSNTLQSLYIVVNAYPVATFEVEDECDGDTFLFNNTSYTPGPDEEVTYQWDFGDGTNSSQTNPLHKYSVASFGGNAEVTFDVTLTVTSHSSTSACTDTYQQEVTVHRRPHFDFGPAVLSFNDTLLTPMDDPGAFLPPGTSYQWARASGLLLGSSESYTIDQTGAYQVNLRSPAGCDSLIDFPVYILEPADLGGDQVFCEGDELEAAPSLSQSLRPHNYRWLRNGVEVQNGAAPDLYVANEGIYRVEISYEVLGMVATTADEVDITIVDLTSGHPACEAALYPEIDLDGPVITCEDSIILDAENAGSDYLWSDGSTDQTLTVTASGVYEVTVTLPNGNSASESVEVTFLDSPEPGLGDDQEVCGSTVLEARVEAVSYLWSTEEETASILVSASGEYAIEVVSEDLCVNRDTVAVTVYEYPELELGEDIAVCDEEEVVLSAGAEGSYVWSTGEATREITVTEQDMYGLALTSSDGCTTEDSVFVTFYPLPEVALDDSYFGCEELTLDAGEAGISYLWSTGANTRYLDVEETGYFWAQVTSAENCIQRDTTLATIYDYPTVDLGEDIKVCAGELVTLDAGDKNALNDFYWSTGAKARTINISASGTYWVRVTNAEGCSTTDSVEVLFHEPVQPDLGENKPFCNAAVLDAGSGGVTYEWGSSIDSTWNTQSIVPPMEGTYWVTITDVEGCTATDSVTFFESNQSIEASFLIPSEVRQGDYVSFVPLTEPEPESYFWEFGNGVTSTSKNPIFQYFIVGEYTVTLTVSNGVCEHSLSKQISVQPSGGRYAVPEGEAYRLIDILSTKIYPNPVRNDRMALSVELTYEAPARISFYDMQGFRVFSHDYHLRQEDELEFDLTGLRQGLYIVRVEAGKQVRYTKFMKVK